MTQAPLIINQNDIAVLLNTETSLSCVWHFARSQIVITNNIFTWVVFQWFFIRLPALVLKKADAKNQHCYQSSSADTSNHDRQSEKFWGIWRERYHLYRLCENIKFRLLLRVLLESFQNAWACLSSVGILIMKTSLTSALHLQSKP